MKWIGWILLAISTPGLAQCGQSGDTTWVTTPSELDALSGCTEILGSLVIDLPEIGSFAPLAGLTSVEEHLIITDNIALLNVSAFSQLTSVGGDLELSNNFTLQQVNGFSSLTALGGDLRLLGNITLQHIDGFSGLAAIHGDVIIRENHVLENLNGFSGLTQLGGDLILNHQNLLLNDLSGIDGVTEVDGSVAIALPFLTTWPELAIETITGSLRLHDMPLVGLLDGWNALREVGDSIWIHNNDNLVSLDALAGLDAVGSAIEITDNNGLFLCCAVANWAMASIPTGALNLANNAAACNDAAAVLANCEPLSLPHQNAASFSPGCYDVSIFDLAGRMTDLGRHCIARPEDVLQQTTLRGFVLATFRTQHGLITIPLARP